MVLGFTWPHLIKYIMLSSCYSSRNLKPEEVWNAKEVVPNPGYPPADTRFGLIQKVCKSEIQFCFPSKDNCLQCFCIYVDIYIENACDITGIYEIFFTTSSHHGLLVG